MMKGMPFLEQLLIAGVLYLILLKPMLYLIDRYIPEEDD
jgi:hypothetical protein